MKHPTVYEVLHSPTAPQAITQDELGHLPTRCYNALVRSGYTTRGSYLRADDHDLLACRYLGAASLRIIRASIPYKPAPAPRSPHHAGAVTP